ncbi:MAG: hypothetical protein C5B45_05525 [Chlamydiae bacterium]|nr:MAG: hypothetical protein C5B45_05525 [Chlamydiota bacterium]
MSITSISDPIIDSIIKYMDEGDKPLKESIERKKNLNKEFGDKAHIKGFVSYIYYPSQREGPPSGHSELEIEGNSYTLLTKARRVRPLSHMIRRAEKGDGMPFFRFNISVTPSQLDKLREGVSTTNSKICSLGVANALKQYANFKIPLPLALLPLLSTIYLTAANRLGSQRIYQIESYGDPLRNLSKIIPGAAMESINILGALGCIIQSSYYAYNLDTDTYAGFFSNKAIEFLYNQQ